MIRFKMLHPKMAVEMLGYIPQFFSEADPRTAAEQINENYQHGGGWRHMSGWSMSPLGALCYKGDRPLIPLAEAHLRDEHIIFYEDEWLAIIQKDGSFEVSRIN